MKSSSQLGSEAHHLSNVVDLGDLCAQKWGGPSLGSECQSHCTKRSTHHHLRELIPAHLDCTLKRVTRETESLNNILSISADMEISEREVWWLKRSHWEDWRSFQITESPPNIALCLNSSPINLAWHTTYNETVNITVEQDCQWQGTHPWDHL